MKIRSTGSTIPDLEYLEYLWLTLSENVCCSKYYLKDIHVLLCEKRGEESLFARVVSRCAASVSLSAVGVSSDDQSGRGWVEKNIGREGRGRKTEREERSDSIYVSTMRLCLAKLSYMNLYT